MTHDDKEKRPACATVSEIGLRIIPKGSWEMRERIPKIEALGGNPFIMFSDIGEEVCPKAR